MLTLLKDIFCVLRQQADGLAEVQVFPYSLGILAQATFTFTCYENNKFLVSLACLGYIYLGSAWHSLFSCTDAASAMTCGS